jgi:hypothetical protein
MVGYAADCFPLRASVAPGVLLPAFVRQIHETFARGCRYRVKWELVQEATKDLWADAIAPVFNFLDAPRELISAVSSESGLSVDPFDVDAAPEVGSASSNMSHVVTLADTGDLVYAHMKYMAARYSRRTAEAFFERFWRCLSAIAHDPFVRVERIMDS